MRIGAPVGVSRMVNRHNTSKEHRSQGGECVLVRKPHGVYQAIRTEPFIHIDDVGPYDSACASPRHVNRTRCVGNAQAHTGTRAVYDVMGDNMVQGFRVHFAEHRRDGSRRVLHKLVRHIRQRGELMGGHRTQAKRRLGIELFLSLACALDNHTAVYTAGV